MGISENETSTYHKTQIEELNLFLFFFNEFDEVADKVKDRIKAELKHNVNRLNYEEINGKIYVELEEVENLIDDAG